MIRYDYQSPIGVLALVADDVALRGLSFENGKHGGPPADAQPGTNAIIDATRRQLDAYFAGRSKTFDLPLAPDGADFQMRVWRALATIPFGETRSYGEIAAMIGAPSAPMTRWHGTMTAVRSPRRRKPYRFWRRHGA
jgi:methylated-DNA-[protein]-cysteine S-methyltransferase